MRASAIALCALALSWGCEKDGADPLAELDAELPESVVGVVEAWHEADLEVDDLRALDGDSEEVGAGLGGDCAAAKVGGVPVVLCEHAGTEEAKAAEKRGLKLVGDSTGLSIARGSILLVAADRHDADPEGRRLNEIANVFRRLD